MLLAIIAYLNVQEGIVNCWIKLFKVDNRRYDASLKHKDGFHHTSYATCTFQVTNVRFRGAAMTVQLTSCKWNWEVQAYIRMGDFLAREDLKASPIAAASIGSPAEVPVPCASTN